MPYDVKWLDEERRFLRVRLFGSVQLSEAEELLNQARSIAETPQPVFVLLDLQQFNMQQAMPQLRGLLEGQAIPRNLDHLENSRAAVVGGGPMVSMGVGLVRQLTGRELMRAFDDEDRALSWLEDEAQRFSGT